MVPVTGHLHTVLFGGQSVPLEAYSGGVLRRYRDYVPLLGGQSVPLEAYSGGVMRRYRDYVPLLGGQSVPLEVYCFVCLCLSVKRSICYQKQNSLRHYTTTTYTKWSNTAPATHVYAGPMRIYRDYVPLLHSGPAYT